MGNVLVHICSWLLRLSGFTCCRLVPARNALVCLPGVYRGNVADLHIARSNLLDIPYAIRQRNGVRSFYHTHYTVFIESVFPIALFNAFKREGERLLYAGMAGRFRIKNT